MAYRKGMRVKPKQLAGWARRPSVALIGIAIALVVLLAWQTERNDALEERIALVGTHAREARDRLRVLEVDAKSLRAQTAILEPAAALGRASAAREVTETAA